MFAYKFDSQLGLTHSPKPMKYKYLPSAVFFLGYEDLLELGHLNGSVYKLVHRRNALKTKSCSKFWDFYTRLSYEFIDDERLVITLSSSLNEVRCFFYHFFNHFA